MGIMAGQCLDGFLLAHIVTAGEVLFQDFRANVSTVGGVKSCIVIINIITVVVTCVSIDR